MLSDLRFRLRAVFRRRSMERELDDELRFHMEHQVEEYRKKGLGEEEARRRARLAVGGLEQLKEQCRDARGSGFADATFRDLSYAARAMRANPGFTLVAVLSLAPGIGANTAVFTVVNALLLRTLPVPDPQDLVIVQSSTKSGVKGVWRRNSNDRLDLKTGRQMNNTSSLDMLQGFRARSSDGLDVFGFFSPGRVSVLGDDASSIAYATVVSDNFFDGLGVSMALGRPLLASDDQPGASTLVVTYDFWRRSLHADAAILGKVVRVNAVPMTVVGVTAPGFTGVSAGGFDGPVDVFAPLNAVEAVSSGWFRSSEAKTSPDLWWIQIMARRKPGVTEELAAARLTSIFQGALRDSGMAALQRAEDPKIVLASGDKGLDSLRRRLERPALVLFGVVGVVLLLASVNVANLLVARGVARRREMAVRLSLGAGRGAARPVRPGKAPAGRAGCAVRPASGRFRPAAAHYGLDEHGQPRVFCHFPNSDRRRPGPRRAHRRRPGGAGQRGPRGDRLHRGERGPDGGEDAEPPDRGEPPPGAAIRHPAHRLRILLPAAGRHWPARRGCLHRRPENA